MFAGREDDGILNSFLLAIPASSTASNLDIPYTSSSLAQDAQEQR